MKNFDEFINNLIAEFSENNSLAILENIKYKISWPEVMAYILFGIKISYENLIYVGLTGKYKRNKSGIIEINSRSFDKRGSRWTPYRFCDSPKDKDNFRFTFRYGPKYSNVTLQGKHKYDEDGYKYTIPYSDLTVATFNVANSDKYSPAYLETLILTRYLKVDGDLPPANNEL